MMRLAVGAAIVICALFERILHGRKRKRVLYDRPVTLVSISQSAMQIRNVQADDAYAIAFLE